MGNASAIYQFAARAGALEGFVYHKQNIDPAHITPWVGHLVEEYHKLPAATRAEFQNLCDGTVGRAICSLASMMGEDHALVAKLKGLTRGPLPSSADDFFPASEE